MVDVCCATRSYMGSYRCTLILPALTTTPGTPETVTKYLPVATLARYRRLYLGDLFRLEGRVLDVRLQSADHLRRDVVLVEALKPR